MILKNIMLRCSTGYRELMAEVSNTMANVLINEVYARGRRELA